MFTQDPFKEFRSPPSILGWMVGLGKDHTLRLVKGAT